MQPGLCENLAKVLEFTATKTQCEDTNQNKCKRWGF